jgi:hypothetical protein
VADEDIAISIAFHLRVSLLDALDSPGAHFDHVGCGHPSRRRKRSDGFELDELFG